MYGSTGERRGLTGDAAVAEAGVQHGVLGLGLSVLGGNRGRDGERVGRGDRPDLPGDAFDAAVDDAAVLDHALDEEVGVDVAVVAELDAGGAQVVVAVLADAAVPVGAGDVAAADVAAHGEGAERELQRACLGLRGGGSRLRGAAHDLVVEGARAHDEPLAEGEVGTARVLGRLTDGRLLLHVDGGSGILLGGSSNGLFLGREVGKDLILLSNRSSSGLVAGLGLGRSRPASIEDGGLDAQLELCLGCTQQLLVDGGVVAAQGHVAGGGVGVALEEQALGGQDGKQGAQLGTQGQCDAESGWG